MNSMSINIKNIPWQKNILCIYFGLANGHTPDSSSTSLPTGTYRVKLGIGCVYSCLRMLPSPPHTARTEAHRGGDHCLPCSLPPALPCHQLLHPGLLGRFLCPGVLNFPSIANKAYEADFGARVMVKKFLNLRSSANIGFELNPLESA